MATQLVTMRWCDWHLRTEPSEQVEATEYRVAFWATDPKREPLVVDLCEPCAITYGATVTDLVALLGPAQAKRTPTAQVVAPGAPVARGKGRSTAIYECPLECGTTGKKQNLKAHVRGRHGTTLPAVAFTQGHTLDGEPIAYVCKEGHDEPQGFGTNRVGIVQHRVRSHQDPADTLDTDLYLA